MPSSLRLWTGISAGSCAQADLIRSRRYNGGALDSRFSYLQLAFSRSGLPLASASGVLVAWFWDLSVATTVNVVFSIWLGQGNNMIISGDPYTRLDMDSTIIDDNPNFDTVIKCECSGQAGAWGGFRLC